MAQRYGPQASEGQLLSVMVVAVVCPRLVHTPGVVSSPCATPVLVVILTLVATKREVLYGVALLFTYALGHTLLMLAAGTFTGFVEGFVKARRLVNFSLWARRVSGAVVALAGGWFVWQGF